MTTCRLCNIPTVA